DRIENLLTAFHAVGLTGQQLLQRVRGPVSFKGPHFHFSEALAAELRLAAEGLLGDQRVRSDRARVDLVVDQVRELEHVNEADADALLERLAGHAVEELRLAVLGESGGAQLRLDLRLDRAVEHRRGEVETEGARGPSEVRLENLTDVHARRHTERV